MGAGLVDAMRLPSWMECCYPLLRCARDNVMDYGSASLGAGMWRQGCVRGGGWIGASWEESVVLSLACGVYGEWLVRAIAAAVV
jgi:hypothetical protein